MSSESPNDLVNSLLKLRGVVDAELESAYLAEFDVQRVMGFENRELPLCSLMRSNAGRENEGLLRVRLRFSKDEAGSEAIEFIAWLIRDRARGGKTNDFRPFALPPVTDHVQLGKSLEYFIEVFDTDTTDGAPLRAIEDLRDSIVLQSRDCDDQLRRHGHPGLLAD